MAELHVWHPGVPIWEGATLTFSKLRAESWSWGPPGQHLPVRERGQGEAAKARGAQGFAYSCHTNRWNQM